MLRQLLPSTKWITSPARIRYLSAATNPAKAIPRIACHLPSRTLIHVHGLDATRFLQGLLTNDVERKLQSPGTAMFCHLLNNKGRSMFEAFVATPSKDCELSSADANVGSYLLECHVEVSAKLIKHLKMHKLRSKVNITSLEESYDVWWSSYDDTKDVATDIACSFEDPRAPTLGHRTFTAKGSTPLLESEDTESSTATYDVLRILHGALEGTEVDGIIPLESNIDWLNGVVFDKGCYLGQELTARTHYRGLLRKRCFPIIFENKKDEDSIPLPALVLSAGEAQDVAYGTVAMGAKVGIACGGESVSRGTNVLNEGKKRAGKLMTKRNELFNVGIAMLRLEHVLGVEKDVVEEDGGGEEMTDELPERLLTIANNGSSTPTLVVRPVIRRG